jgi:hypothetical protein
VNDPLIVHLFKDGPLSPSSDTKRTTAVLRRKLGHAVGQTHDVLSFLLGDGEEHGVYLSFQVFRPVEGRLRSTNFTAGYPEQDSTGGHCWIGDGVHHPIGTDESSTIARIASRVSDVFGVCVE